VGGRYHPTVSIDEISPDDPPVPPPADPPPDLTADLSAKPAKRKHPKWLIAIEVLTVLIVVAPFVAEAISSHLGSSITASGNFQVTVQNDTSATLTVRSCGAGCPPSADSVVLSPGSETEVSVSDRGDVSRYYLAGTSGAVTGCLPLRFTAARSGVIVHASEAVPCPGSPISP
jgi:hypothetical protein